MKTSLAARAGALCCSAVLALSARPPHASAQSGRVVVAKPTPELAAPPPKAEGVPATFVPEPGAEKYRLVYAADECGGVAGCEPAGRHARFNSFIKQLNNAGARGYRLMSVTNHVSPFAVMRLDGAPYEYGWFETGNETWYASGGFFGVFGQQAKGGFRLAERFFVSKYCEWRDPNDFLMGEECTVTELYLVERRKGVEKPREFYLAGSMPGWRSRMAEQLTAQVRERLDRGLYPTHAFSRFEVLLEEVEGVAGARPEMQVVTLGTWGKGDIDKKVNEAARQGWRLAVVGHKVAVMERAAAASPPATYVWVKAKEKDFEKRLAQLRESGAVYRMTYPDGDGQETRLVFERGAAGSPRRDYRVFKFESQDALKVTGRKLRPGDLLGPPTKESVQAFEQLLKEGYEVRDLFVSDKVSALLERPQ